VLAHLLLSEKICTFSDKTQAGFLMVQSSRCVRVIMRLLASWLQALQCIKVCGGTRDVVFDSVVQAVHQISDPARTL
jgi:hypothetical protein